MRFLARALTRLRAQCPGIRFHLYSGNGEDVAERLSKGLLDFGLFVGRYDFQGYDYITLPAVDVWGLLLRKDHPYAKKECITPADMRNVPLLSSRQVLLQNELSGWLGYPFGELNVVGSYNLIFNAALLVEEGAGCALCIDNLVNTQGESPLCFRPFYPRLTAFLTVAWKKYQVFSPAARRFLEELQKSAG